MQFFVIGTSQILVEIAFGALEPRPGHLVGPAVLRTGHVGAARLPAPEDQAGQQAGEGDHAQENEEQGRAGEEGAFLLEVAVAEGDVADILAQAAYALAIGPGHGDAAAGNLFALFDGHGNLARRGGDILAVRVVVVTVFDRRNHEIAVAAGNERILEGLRAVRAAGGSLVGALQVIDLEIRREIHLRRLEHREVAVAGNRDQQRTGLVRLEVVLAQFRGNLEVAYAALERGRRARGQILHVDLEGRRADAFAQGLILVEEIVENGERAAARGADPHLAHHLGRIDRQRAALLGNQHPLAQQGRIVDGAVHVLPLELQVVDRDGLLAPESVESREFDVFKTRDVGAGVDLEGGGNGFALDHPGLAQRQAQEDVLVGDGARDGGIVLLYVALLPLRVLLPLVPRAGGAGVVLAAGDDLDLEGRRGHGLLPDGGGSRRNREGPRVLGLQDVGDGFLMGGRAFPVDDVGARHRTFLRAPDHVEIVGAGPFEIAQLVVGRKDDPERLVL